MRLKDTLLGLVVLALVVGGFAWVRLRPSASQSGSTEPTSDGAVHSPDARRVATAAADAALPDATLADAAVNVGDVRVTLSVAPHPPVAFQKNRFRVRVESAGGAVPLENGRISFEMTMPMGDHTYTFVPGEGGWQEAEVVLPMCGSGNPRWYATVEGTAAGQPRTARFRIDLTKP